jgi:hypothetical protein
MPFISVWLLYTTIRDYKKGKMTGMMAPAILACSIFFFIASFALLLEKLLKFLKR